MPVGWFICPYARDPRFPGEVVRYCTMDDFTAVIFADGGGWSESEILGDAAVVKVRASAATLTTINAAAGFTRIPLARLDERLSSLTQAQRTAIRDKLNALGYPLQEIADAIGDLGSVTLRDVLRFAARRRLKPRYDAATDSIILDGPIQPCRPIGDVDVAVN